MTYHFPMGCALHNDFREKKVYLATPVPTPWDLTALECREVKGDGKKTLGAGGLWFLKRDPKRVLITESILDSLAGEIVLEDKEISLCALNSAAYVNQLGEFLKDMTRKRSGSLPTTTGRALPPETRRWRPSPGPGRKSCWWRTILGPG